MPAKFPARRSDGSFCVDVVFGIRTARTDLAHDVDRWVNSWIREHEVWRFFDEDVKYDQEFDGPPVVASCSREQLVLRLWGKPGSKRWKDLLVLGILEGLCNAFAELSVDAVKDGPEPDNDVA